MYKPCVENYGLKYNFESNSQPEVDGYYIVGCWELWSKIQFWKQFTTQDTKIQRYKELRIMV